MFEVNHMFIARLLLFILRARAVAFIDEGRLALHFELRSVPPVGSDPEGVCSCSSRRWLLASCFIAILQPVRLMMKAHSFVPRVLSWAEETVRPFQRRLPGPVEPQVSQYLYFLFAPTLISRDKFPRYKQIMCLKPYFSQRRNPDWWNSTSFANYYRPWNAVVHDWLYYYVSRDHPVDVSEALQTSGHVPSFLELLKPRSWSCHRDAGL
ncbi:hypothetical protein KUCAC02_032132 [Chaenocephalus aceratus]|nr:hypothetical protein KUCAC02_032132 [Chaenocephalus aceratus]